MDSVQRQIVHELAKYYFLDTESVGTDANRYVVVTKKIGSRPPLFTLSQVSSMQSSLPAITSISKDVVQTHGAAHLAAAASPMSTLHLYDLSRSVKTTHLQHFLRDFEGLYVLQWIDESNALAIFHQPNFFVKALSTLNDTTGIIKVRAYKDTNPTSDRQGNVVLGEKYVPPQKRPQPESGEATPPPPVEVSDFKTVVSGSKKKTLDPTESIQTTNMFSALLAQQNTEPPQTNTTPVPTENPKFEDWEDIPKPKTEEDQPEKKDDPTVDEPK